MRSQMIGGAESMEFGPSASHQGFSGNQFPHFHPPQEDKPSPAGEVGGLHVFCARDKGKLCKKTSVFRCYSDPRTSRDITEAGNTIPHPLIHAQILQNSLAEELHNKTHGAGCAQMAKKAKGTWDGSGIVWEQEQGRDCPDCPLCWAPVRDLEG